MGVNDFMSRSNKQAPLPMKIYVTEAQMFTDEVMFYSCIYIKFRLVSNFPPNSLTLFQTL